MHLRALLLLFCPLVFSANVLLGTMDDYQGESTGQYPIDCSVKGLHEFGGLDLGDTKEKIDARMELAYDAIKKCVSEMASANANVKKVEHALAKKIYDVLRIDEVDMMQCDKKLKTTHSENKCYRSKMTGSGDYFCNEHWGKDGCMIKIYNKECGEGMADKVREFALFMYREQKECVDKYFK